MSDTLVSMTNSTLPGVVKIVNLNAYRYAWYDEGWRSADDPGWHGAGTEVDIPHAGDNSIHGGGIELDYADIGTSNKSYTATGFALTEILRVTVPTLLRPVYLIADLATGPVTTTSGLNIALISQTNFLNALPIAVASKTRVLYSVPAIGTEPNGRPLTISHRIPAGSVAEDWLLAASIASGATTAQMIGNVNTTCSLRAITA